MLAWRTERSTEPAVEPETIKDDYAVPVRPEQVVEIAFDGLQRSTRYPARVGPALCPRRPLPGTGLRYVPSGRST